MAGAFPRLLRPSLLLLLLSSFVLSSAASTSTSDTLALLSLKSSFTNTTALSTWTNDSTPCHAGKPWRGVMCFNGVVTGLRLRRMGLSGTVNIDALSRIRGLRTISLVDNSFFGKIPAFAKLPALKAIYLSKNDFTGIVPDDFFSGMTHLKKLWLSGNSFSGDIPSSISDLSLLLELHLENNNFTGGLPDVDLPALKSFNVSNNMLKGNIPAKLAKFGADSFGGNSGLCGGPLEGCSPETASRIPPKEVKSDKKAAVVVIMMALIVALVVIGLAFKRRRPGGFDTLGATNNEMESVEVSNRSKRQGSSWHSRFRQESSKKSSTRPGLVAELVMVSDEKGAFGLPDLMKAAAEVLGNGSLGSGYKAVMGNGATVVVKRMKEMNRLPKEGFDVEMRRIGRLRHPNLLPPMAYHYRKEEKLIVFEYVEKGSLLYLLHGERGPSHAALDWPTRQKIIIGVTRGMSYLHQFHHPTDDLPPHGNLKSSNVLLTATLDPLITDYGYAPFLSTPHPLLAFRTPDAHPTPKSDVYCLGVLVLEIMTGKGGTDVVEWARVAVAERREVEVVDPELVGMNASVGSMERMVRFGVELVELDIEKRPTMAEAARRAEEMAVGSWRAMSGRENVGEKSGRRGDGSFDL